MVSNEVSGGTFVHFKVLSLNLCELSLFGFVLMKVAGSKRAAK